MLATILPNVESWYPKDSWKRHAIDSALDFNGTDFRPKLMKRNKAFFAQMANKKVASPAIQA